MAFAYSSYPYNCSFYTSIQGYWKSAPTHSHSCRLGWASVYLVYTIQREERVRESRKVARLDDQQRVLGTKYDDGAMSVTFFPFSFFAPTNCISLKRMKSHNILSINCFNLLFSSAFFTEAKSYKLKKFFKKALSFITRLLRLKSSKLYFGRRFWTFGKLEFIINK
jgi:hypothetical protein